MDPSPISTRPVPFLVSRLRLLTVVALLAMACHHGERSQRDRLEAVPPGADPGSGDDGTEDDGTEDDGTEDGGAGGEGTPRPCPVDLLHGRLTVVYPARADVRPFRGDIMGAPTPSADETRVMLDVGPERVVTFAQEEYHTANSDLAAQVRALVPRWSPTDPDARVEPLDLTSVRLRAVRVEWNPPDPHRGSILAATVAVASPDTTVQTLDWYVNPAAWQSHCARLAAVSQLPRGAGCAAVIRAIATTLRPGRRTALDRRGGLRMLPGTPLLAVLPARWLATAERGPDFTVVRLRQVTPLGVPGLTLGVYAGFAPSRMHRDGTQAHGVAGWLLGESITWDVWQTRDANGVEASYMETVQPVPGYERYVVHVFAAAVDPASLATLRQIARTLRSMPRTRDPAAPTP